MEIDTAGCRAYDRNYIVGGDSSKDETKSPGKGYNAPKQEAKQAIDQNIVDRIMLLTSTAIQMADVAVQRGKIHGAYIRVSADDFDGKSWAAVYATVYNIRDGWSELDALETDKTRENVQRFLFFTKQQRVCDLTVGLLKSC